ncbi:anti-sigma factor family protein [Rhodanobacter soli]|uniref:anti-sigma factor family protein n=1 Tax=Rhodanobacter soli TaxID=590609 RepID=UPI0031D73ADE
MTFPMDSGKDCVRAWEAMPWVLQDSATQEQGAWLEDHLAQCESCRAEFAQQSRLRLALSLPADVPVDADVGLGRLLARLDMPDPQELRLRSRPGNWLSRALVAAVLVQALGLGVLGVKLWSGGGEPSYRTLSQETLPAAPGAIRVVPDAGMTLADWNALLHALRLQVVSGPNDVGAYTVAPVSSASTAQHALQQLRTTRGILLAEPVAVTP